MVKQYRPIRPRPSPGEHRKNAVVMLVGNCQMHRFQYVMDVQGFRDYEFHANSDSLGLPFEPDRVRDKIAEGGTVVAQAVMNESHPLHFRTLQALNSNILFVPYIFIDGIFSLSSASGVGSFAYGQDRVEAMVATEGALPATRAMRAGAIDFDNVRRFEGSVAELRRREALCPSVRVSDYILATYRRQCPVTTHNHPAPHVFDQFCGQVFHALGIPYRPLASTNHAEQVVYAFSQTPRLFTPYDVDLLGLHYPADEQWYQNGQLILENLYSRVYPDQADDLTGNSVI